MPDYDKLAAMIVRDKWGDVGIADALRAAYEAGLDAAVDIVAETCRVRLFNIIDANAYIANIEREKEAEHG